VEIHRFAYRGVGPEVRVCIGEAHRAYRRGTRPREEVQARLAIWRNAIGTDLIEVPQRFTTLTEPNGGFSEDL
jgi:hypothetical protein